MKKLIALAALLSSPAYAEINPDPGFDSPGSWMAMGKTPQPTVSSSKAHFTGASKMTMLMISAPGVKRGHKYAVSMTVSNYSAGGVEAVLSRLMMGTPTGAAYASPNGLTGETPIADNFTTSSSLVAVPDLPVGPKHTGSQTDVISSFRTFCSYSHTNADDSLVYANQPGTSHLHGYCGNTKADAYSTFTSLRTKGSTTAGNIRQPKEPANRSAYWFPQMLTDDGRVVPPTGINLYYKQPWNGHPYCKSYPSNLGSCVEVPNGLRWIFGFDFSTHSMPTSAYINWTGYTYAGPSMNAAIDDCLANGCHVLVAKLLAYQCWNGTQLDTANHRDHMSDMQPGSLDNYQCPDSHPYHIPEISLQIFFHIDALAAAHRWHLSSDEMDGTFAGETLHMDYREAWSPTVRHGWQQGCMDDNQSCGDGEMGNGFAIKDAGLLTQPILSGNLDTHAEVGVPVPYERVEDYGRSKPCRANGTCTWEITAASDGAIQVMSWDGFVGDVDNFTVVEIEAGKHG